MLFGFAAPQPNDSGTLYGMVSAQDEAAARALLALELGTEHYELIDAEGLVDTQYRSFALLSTEYEWIGE